MRCRVYFVCLVSHTHIHAHTHTHTHRYTITSRRKSLFSTFKKMYQKNKNLEGIKDVFAMRIVIGLNPDVREDPDMQVCGMVGVLRPRGSGLGGSRPGLNPMLRIRCKHGANTLRTSRQCVIYGARVYFCCLRTKPRDRPYRTQGGR